MKIGQRNYMILKEIINNSMTVTGKELEAKLHLTRKQLEYGIAKINTYLEEQQLPILERISSGRIIVPDEVINQVNLRQLEWENQEVWFSKEERSNIIQLMLLTKQEELSLQHFIEVLKVSKNTVLSDFKRLKAELANLKIRLVYTREQGYVLKGQEYDLRQRLFAVLLHMLSGYGQYGMAAEIGEISKPQLEHIREMTEKIEREMKNRFTDEMIEVNSYFFTLILRRIRQGMVLDKVPDTFRHVAGTKEYMVIKSCLAAEDVNNIYETMYFTAHIQSMKTNSNLEAVAGQNEVYRAVEETISNFERIACVCVLKIKIIWLIYF